MGQIRLIGSREFIDRTKNALTLLKEKDFMSYKVVIRNLGAIVDNKDDMSYFTPFKEVPVFFVNERAYRYSVTWYASAILHDAYHGELFKNAVSDGIDPISEYSGYVAEMYCLTKQIECMKRIGAPRHEILHAINCYGKEWWVHDKSEVSKKIK